MRKLLFLFIAVFAFSCSSDDGGNTTNPENPNPVTQCTNVFEGSVSLTSQAEVDAFAAHGYCGIKGDLSIGNTEAEPSNITNLNGLATLAYIDGILFVHDNPGLANMQGLHNIKEVIQLRIERDDALVNLNGLTSLSIIRGSRTQLGSLGISNNKLLENLEGIGAIAETEGIYISDNPKLLSIEALNSVQKVIKRGGIGITANALLTNLKGLENIIEVDSVSILFNDSLLTLEGLQNIHSVSDIFIQGNISLISISHLSGVETITNAWLRGTSMIIDYNYALTSLDGLQNITNFTGEGQIQSNLKLKDLCAISNLVINGTYIHISSNFHNPNKQAFIAGKCSVQ